MQGERGQSTAQCLRPVGRTDAARITTHPLVTAETDQRHMGCTDRMATARIARVGDALMPAGMPGAVAVDAARPWGGTSRGGGLVGGGGGGVGQCSHAATVKAAGERWW